MARGGKMMKLLLISPELLVKLVLNGMNACFNFVGQRLFLQS